MDSKSRIRWVMNNLLGLNLLGGFILTGCAQTIPTVEKPPPAEPTKPLILSVTPSKETPSGAISETQPSKQIIITGWFTTIWNGEPHYTITDEQEQDTQLLLDEKTAKPLGGPLQLDRKRVTIIGEMISESPRVVRVLSVKFASPE